MSIEKIKQIARENKSSKIVYKNGSIFIDPFIANKIILLLESQYFNLVNEKINSLYGMIQLVHFIKERVSLFE
jgi:hypothetical protein